MLADWGHSSPWCLHVFRVSYCWLIKYYCVVIKKKRFFTVLTDWGHSSPWCLHVFRVSYCRLMKYYCVVIKKNCFFYSVNWLRSQFTMMSACLSSVLLSTNRNIKDINNVKIISFITDFYLYVKVSQFAYSINKT